MRHITYHSKNTHQWHEARRRTLLFPTVPTGPFCYLRQHKHPEPFSKRTISNARREGARWKQHQRNLMLEGGDE